MWESESFIIVLTRRGIEPGLRTSAAFAQSVRPADLPCQVRNVLQIKHFPFLGSESKISDLRCRTNFYTSLGRLLIVDLGSYFVNIDLIFIFSFSVSWFDTSENHLLFFQRNVFECITFASVFRNL